MKVVILAGGMGSRMNEETMIRPKPLIEIGNMPILWHICKYYAQFGHNEFIICTGYKGEMIKDFFLNYNRSMSNVTVDLSNDNVKILNTKSNENWKVSIIDTGLNTKTAGRIKQIESYLGEDNTFAMTYGDGLSNININKLIQHHQNEGKIATVSGIHPSSKYGNILSAGNEVVAFEEKPENDSNSGIINGGFFVLEKEIFNYIQEDDYWEGGPIKRIVSDNQLNLYRHEGWWGSMDTVREKDMLNKLWEDGVAPWKIW